MSKINPKLTAKLKKQRKIATTLEAFNRVMVALHGFERKTQRSAIQATWELIKP